MRGSRDLEENHKISFLMEFSITPSLISLRCEPRILP